VVVRGRSARGPRGAREARERPVWLSYT